MPYTLEKLQEIRERLDQGDVLGACKPLNELIDRYKRMWNEYLRVRLASSKQRLGSAAVEGSSPHAGKDAIADSSVLSEKQNAQQNDTETLAEANS